jgi:hypothetical protein
VTGSYGKSTLNALVPAEASSEFMPISIFFNEVSEIAWKKGSLFHYDSVPIESIKKTKLQIWNIAVVIKTWFSSSYRGGGGVASIFTKDKTSELTASKTTYIQIKMITQYQIQISSVGFPRLFKATSPNLQA